jgi:hypothetical protein
MSYCPVTAELAVLSALPAWCCPGCPLWFAVLARAPLLLLPDFEDPVLPGSMTPLRLKLQCCQGLKECLSLHFWLPHGLWRCLRLRKGCCHKCCWSLQEGTGCAPDLRQSQHWVPRPEWWLLRPQQSLSCLQQVSASCHGHAKHCFDLLLAACTTVLTITSLPKMVRPGKHSNGKLGGMEPLPAGV